MGLSGPLGLSVEQQASLWSRWKAGYPMRDIGRAFRVDHAVFETFCVFTEGSCRPRDSAVGLRWLSARVFPRGIASGESIRAIARRLR